MITYLYGADKYRIKEYLCEHASGAMVGKDALKTVGLFNQAPVILYDIPNDLKIPEDVEVFIVSEKKIKKGIEFKLLKGTEIREWMLSELRKQGFAIAPDAIALLEKRYIDTWQTKLQLDKLCNYAYKKRVITLSDMDAVSDVAIEENIFRLTDAIANKNKRDAILLLDGQLASGADPYYLFSMVVFQFRNMLAPGRLGLHPYAAQKARTAAGKFDAGKLKKLYESLHQLEIDVKKGIRNMEEGLYQFIFSV